MFRIMRNKRPGVNPFFTTLFPGRERNPGWIERRYNCRDTSSRQKSRPQPARQEQLFS